MAFSFFKRSESRETEPSPMTPVDLVVEAEALKAKLKKSSLTGSRLAKYEIAASGLRDRLKENLKQKKIQASDQVLLEEAHGLLEEIEAFIGEYQDAPNIEAEYVAEEYEVAGATLKKEFKERSRKNQDTMVMDTQADLFGVFDGLGGAAAGEKASESAAHHTQEAFAKFPETKSVEVIKNWMAETLKDASRRIRAESLGDGRGTTASVVKLWEGSDGKKKAIVGNVGDSRVYVYRAKTGKLEQVTLDDTAVLTATESAARSLRQIFARDIGGFGNRLYDQFQTFLSREGYNEEQIFIAAPKSKAEAKRMQEEMNQTATNEEFEALSPYQKFYFEFNNMVDQALGEKEDVQPQVHVVDVEEGDVLVMTSDGIHDNLPDQRIQEILASGKSADEIAHDLANESQMASHGFSFRVKPDDMTAVVVKLPMKEKKQAESKAA